MTQRGLVYPEADRYVAVAVLPGELGDRRRFEGPTVDQQGPGLIQRRVGEPPSEMVMKFLEGRG